MDDLLVLEIDFVLWVVFVDGMCGDVVVGFVVIEDVVVM